MTAALDAMVAWLTSLSNQQTGSPLHASGPDFGLDFGP